MRAQVSLSWQAKNKSVDLDLALALFTSYGQLVNLTFHNQLHYPLSAKRGNRAVEHSGDRTGLAESADAKEELEIDFACMPPHVSYCVVLVCCASACDLSAVRSATVCAVSDVPKKVLALHEDDSASRSFVPFSFKRDDTDKRDAKFVLVEHNLRSTSFGLSNIWPLAFSALQTMIDPITWAESPQKKIGHLNLQKDQSVILENTDKVFFGLGWDSYCDLDAHCYMLTSKKIVDHISYKKLKSSCGSVRHTGDNLTGEGSGDDERIHVTLSEIPEHVVALFFTVEIYTTRKTFKQVKGEYVRVVSYEQGQQKKDDSWWSWLGWSNQTSDAILQSTVLCKYALDKKTHKKFDKANAGLFCILRRVGWSWQFEATAIPRKKGRENFQTLQQHL